MPELNDAAAVRAQYGTSGNLSTRISIHEKYSVNKQGFGNWITEHYRFPEGARVLELGCGTGGMWSGRDGLIRSCAELVLSDFSEGMLEKARDTLKAYPEIRFEQIDIQQIPYADGTFDAVIANMMLYHVPDRARGLREVRRVLKAGGSFYCATYGEHGIIEYLCGLFAGHGEEGQANVSFTLQNGEAQLRAVFDRVQRYDYEDALAVTDPEDLADYIYSLSGMSGLREMPRAEILSVLRAHLRDGVLRVPKEYGMFISQ